MKNYDKINIMEERRGIILNNNVGLEDLKAFKPRFFPDFIKFVINPKLNKVNIGMAVHAACLPEMGDKEDLIGGNIFFDDGHVVWESTLNINKGKDHDPNNRRIVIDKESIEQFNLILNAWVNLDND